MANVGYATLSIIPSAKGFASALGGEIDSPLASAGKKAGTNSGGGFLDSFKGKLGLIKGIAGSAAVTATLGFMKGCVSSAAEMEQTVGGVSAVFGENAQQILEWGKNADDTANMSATAYNRFATQFGNSLQNAGVQGADAMNMSNDLLHRAADSAALLGYTTEEAADAFGAAFRGEYDPIEKFTGGMKAAEVEAYALEKGLIAPGEPLNENARAMATFELIMQKTAKAEGQVAREGNTMAGATEKLGAKWENLKTAIGEKFLPLVAPVVSWIGDVVGGFADLISGGGSGAPGWFTTVGDALRPLGEAFMGLIQSMQPFFNWLSTAVPPILQGFMTIWSSIWNGIVAVFSGVFQTLQGIFQVFSGIFSGDWSLVWEGIKNVFSGVWNALSGIVEAALGWVKGNIEVLCATIKAIWDGAWSWIKHWFSFIWDGIKTVASAAWEWLKSVFSGGVEWVKSVWDGAWNGIKSFFSTIWDGIKSIASGAWEFMKACFNAGVTFIKALWDGFWNGLRAIVDAVWNGIKSAVSGAINFVKDTISNTVNAIKTIWENVWNSVKDFVSTAWNNIKNAISDGINGAVEFIRGFPQKAMDALGNLGSKLFESGKALIQGFIDGIKSMAENIGDSVSGVLDKVRDFFPFSPAKKGPFSGLGYTTYSGRALASDFAAGIRAGQGAALSAAAGLAGVANTALLNASSATAGLATAAGATGADGNVWTSMGQAAAEGITTMATTMGDGMTLINEDWATKWATIVQALGLNWDAAALRTSESMLGITTQMQTGMLALQTNLVTTLNAMHTSWTTTWTALLTHIQTLWPILQETTLVNLTTMNTTVTTQLTALQTFWNTTWTAIQNHLIHIMSIIMANIASAMSNIAMNINTFMYTIQMTWTNGWNAVKNVVAAAWNDAVTACRNGINNVVTVISSLPGNIRGAIGDVGSVLKGSGESLMNGFIEGMRAASDRMGSVVADLGVPGANLGAAMSSVGADALDAISAVAPAMLDAANAAVSDTYDALRIEAPEIAAPHISKSVVGTLAGQDDDQRPLVGNLTFQSSGNFREDLNETMFHLRRLSRGGAHA